jgi:hypothetical protein
MSNSTLPTVSDKLNVWHEYIIESNYSIGKGIEGGL